MKTCISVIGLERWFGGDFAGQAELVRIADERGIDQVSVVDHVVMGEDHSAYPYGAFPGGLDTPWLEPLVQLAFFASVTRRIRLASGIIISPLRAAPVLAKQIATLEVLSRGRVDIGLGVGWQKAEYEACGVAWEDRFEVLAEQAAACRALWGAAPASFAGKHVRFHDMYAIPLPPRGAATPIWFGIAPLPKNIDRIARLGDGWLPMERDPAKLAGPIAKIRAAVAEAGRNPNAFDVRASYQVQLGASGQPDLEKTLAQTASYANAGVTVLRAEPAVFCRTREDYEPFLDRVLAVAREVG
jgi:probable F420-dependent oxidoreductase